MSTRSRVRPVVVGVDGSEATRIAIAWAVDYALGSSAPLRLLAAYEPDALEAGLAAAGAQVDPRNRPARARAREQAYAAASYARSLGFTLPLETACVADPASRALLDESRDALVVVVGARRLGRLQRSLSGSTAAATSVKASCPLVVVRERPSRSVTDTRVIVGIDGPRSRDAAAFAFAEARRTGSGLTAVNAWQLSTAHLGSLVSPAHKRRKLEACSHELLDGIVQPLMVTHPGVDVRRYVTEGAVTTVLEKMSMNARLLVVSSRGLSPVPALLLGSVSRQMITRAHCPVAVVHPEAPTVRYAVTPAVGIEDRSG